MKHFEKIDAEVKLMKEKEIEVDRKLQEFIQGEREAFVKAKLALK